MIKNLVFDFGNVLLRSDFAWFLDCITSDEQVKQLFREVVFSRTFTAQLDLGYKRSEVLFAELAAQYPILSPTLQKFENRWMDHLLGEMPGMYELLSKYKQKGYKLYGLSNWSDMIYPVIEKYPIFKLLDGRVISCEEHTMKPDSRIYEILLERFNLKPEECLFTDDKPENIIAAQHVGMQAVLFDDALQLQTYIEHHLI